MPMPRKRARIIVEVDLDPVPGWGDNPEHYVRLLQSDLDRQISHYHPSVRFDQILTGEEK